MKTRILFLGNEYTGKSQLAEVLVNSNFNENIMPTIGVEFFFLFKTLQIWNPSGKVGFHSITKCYYSGTNIMFYCLDLSDPATEEEIKKIINEFKEKVPNAHLILVGTKNDQSTQKGRDILEAVKQKYSVEAFITSAKDNTGIKELRQCLQNIDLQFSKPFLINDIINSLNLPQDDASYVRQQFEALVNNAQSDDTAQQTFINNCVSHFENKHSATDIVLKALITAIIAAVVIGSIGYGIAFALGVLTVTTALIIAGTAATAGAVSGSLKAYSLFKGIKDTTTSIEYIAPRAMKFHSSPAVGV